MQRLMVFILTMGCVLAVAGCSAPARTPLSDQALQATVQTAVEATVEVQQAQQVGNIERAVQATVQSASTSSAATSAAAVTPTAPAPTLAPVPYTPEPVGQYEAMSESELAAYIQQTIITAAAKTEAASIAATAAAADQVVTQAEYEALTVAVNNALGAVFAAESAITAFYTQYGALAGETLALLQQMDEELATMNTALITLNEAAIAISAALQQGQTVAAAMLTQLATATQQAQAALKAAQDQAQNWLNSVNAALDQRVTTVQAVQPNAIANTAIDALQNANQYLSAVRTALADNQVAPDELTQISIISANATASLKAVGNPELQQLADSISTMTTQLAHGDLPQLKLSLSGLKAMPARP